MEKLKILYEDKELIVVDKPSGLLAISDNKGSRNLYSEVSSYVKKQYPKNKIFIVHRLDKDTSGIVLFAKNEKIKKELQDNWNTYYREYIAVVEGIPKLKKRRLENYLEETKSLFVYVSKDKKKGKLAITNYEVVKECGKYSILKITIETGRKNQIRAQLSYIGHPIVGDKKYSAKMNFLRRLGLHANKLVIIHPKTGKKIEFITKLPKGFSW